MFEIREPRTDEMQGLFFLRWHVLRKPFGLHKGSEQDTEDKTGEFVVAVDMDSQDLLGCARLNVYDNASARINYVVVKEGQRGKRIGHHMIRYLLQRAQESGCSYVFVHARQPAQGFYEKEGFLAIAEPFAKPPTDLPHIRMEYHFA